MHKTNPIISDIDFVTAYSRIRPTYEQFVLKLQILLKDVLDLNGLKYHSIEGRAKSIESFTDKIRRPGKGYFDPLEELPDLAGLRAIVYYVDDVAKVCNLIDKEFVIDKKRSVDKLKNLSPDQFGYLSIHKVITLKPSRFKLPEWIPYKGMFAEIQIRTVLQHAWASISHALQYKRETEIPTPLRRKLIRLSGLLELADDQFIELRDSQEAFVKNVTVSISKNDLDLPIDIVSLRQYLETSTFSTVLTKAIKATRLQLDPFDEQSASKLIIACNARRVETIMQLDLILGPLAQRSTKFFSQFYRDWSAHNPSVNRTTGDLPHWVLVLLFGAGWQDLDTEKNLAWSPEYNKMILTVGKRVFGR